MGKTRKKNKVKDGSSSADDGFFEGAEVSEKWFVQAYNLPDADTDSVLPDSEVKSLRLEAQKALENQSLLYSNKSSKLPGKSNYEWLRTIMTKGTVSDRIAANTVMIQNSPIHNLSILRNLVNMVKVGKKKECTAVIDTLTELFLTDLLIPDKKLSTFESQPLAAVTELKGSARTSRLVHWYFEDQLKELYCQFIQALQAAAQDSVEANKEKAISAMYKLLAGNPEQESLLLRNLVNKLGDPSSKVSSKTIHCLTRLLQQHPNMKAVVMQEIEKLIFRPNVSSRAQYYGICFLTLFILSREDVELAVNLINLYFSFFKACLKKGDVDTRLMSALLMGVNRAYPFAKEKLVGIENQIETVYKVVHIASFNVSVHALRLLYQVTDHTSAVSDRFYSALYKKLLDPQLSTSSHQAMFLNLVFQALKKDVSDSRVKAFIKRLLQVCLFLPVPLVCGILYLISQLVHNNKSLLALTLKANSCSALGNVDDDEEEEHYEDIKIEEEEEVKTVSEEQGVNHIDSEPVGGEEKSVSATWFHCQNLKGKGTKSAAALGQYDPNQRNPLFAGGDFCCYTELVELCNHFHPSVSLFAKKILQGETIFYSGDPLQDFTLARFLERFVFKNPKKQVSREDKPNVTFSRKANYQPLGIKSLAVNSSNYLNSDEAAIPVDELFMYKYLSRKRSGKPETGEDDESDVDSVGSEEFEDMLDNLMGGKEKDIDFADEVGDKLAPSKDEDPGEDSEDEDDDISGHGSDNDLDDDSAEDIVFDDDGEEDEKIDFDINNLPDDDEDDDDIFEDSGKKFKEKKGKKRKDLLKGDISRSVFASADEFAEMLEDAGDANMKLGGLASLSNKDKAGVKQLKWEMDRDHWLKGPKRRKRKDQHHSRPHKKFKR